MPRRNKLWTILTISIATMLFGTAMISRDAEAATTPIIAVSPFATGRVGFPAIGDTFSINITLAQATKIPNYQFTLHFNTTILNATTADTLAPFVTPAFGNGYIIDETRGNVTMAYYTTLGDDVGITTVDPRPIATIGFIVTANGTTTLDLLGSIMTDTLGIPVEPIEADGMFSNVEVIEKHDISITNFVISTSTATVGDLVSIDVTVKNNGDFNETFAVSTDYNGILIRNETNILLKPGESKTINYVWNTANVQDGTYLVTAKVSVAQDDFPSDNTRSGAVTITGGGGGGLLSNPFVLFGIAIVIIVIVAIVIYALRARKPR